MFARTRIALAAVTLTAAAVSCGYGTKTKSEEPKTATDVKSDSGEDEESMEDIEKYLEEEGESSTSTESTPSDSKAGGGAAPSSDAQASDAPRQTPEERRNAIVALVKAKRESVASCYKMAKKKNPKLGTKIAVSFVLKPDGKLKSEPVIEKERSDIDDPDVVKCTIDVIKSIEFPPHPKGMETSFTYPFGF